jgi:hypothetical protein
VPKTRRRNRNREQFWRDTLAAWRNSGQSVRAFYAARGFSEATFYARRRELADNGPRGIPPHLTALGPQVRRHPRRHRPEG